MTPDQIKHMVHRFLMWELPRNLNPDGGISFKPPEIKPGNPWWPVGTNLLDATQATAMVEHMTEGLPETIDIEALKDRPLPPPSSWLSDDERDHIAETYAAIREHVAEMMEEIHSVDRPRHSAFERRMRRISFLLWQIRVVEDDVRERDRVRRTTPLTPAPDWDAVEASLAKHTTAAPIDLSKAEGDGNT